MRADVKEALRGRSVTFLGSNREIRKLPEYLHDGEVVHDMAACSFGTTGGRALMIATNERVLIFKDGWIFKNSQGMSYQDIRSVEINTGLFFASLQFHGEGMDFVVTKVGRFAADHFIRLVRGRIGARFNTWQHSPASQPQYFQPSQPAPQQPAPQPQSFQAPPQHPVTQTNPTFPQNRFPATRPVPVQRPMNPAPPTPQATPNQPVPTLDQFLNQRNSNPSPPPPVAPAVPSQFAPPEFQKPVVPLEQRFGDDPVPLDAFLPPVGDLMREEVPVNPKNAMPSQETQDFLAELERLEEMHRKGRLSDGEFMLAKQKLLGF